jgi:hypothetical protein
MVGEPDHSHSAEIPVADDESEIDARRQKYLSVLYLASSTCSALRAEPCPALT